MKLSSAITESQKKRLIREKFALLAKVGHAKRKASAYQEAEEFYSSIATEALAVSTELLLYLQEYTGQGSPEFDRFVASYTSRQHNLVRSITSFWPKNSDSQERALAMLDSDGLLPMIEHSDEGYVSLSMDQILSNVELAIAASTEDTPKQSSD